MSNWLVVGPNGFLGRNLVELLINEVETPLVALGRRGTHSSKLEQCFDDFDSLQRSGIKFEVIFLLAAYLPYGAWDKPTPELVNSNVKLVENLCTAYPEAQVVFSSSTSVYGNPIGLPLSIYSPFNNPTLYGLSKLAGEFIVRNHQHYSIIRFSSIIGKGMKEQSFVPCIVNDAKTTGKIFLRGTGERLQNYIDVRDAASLCLACARRPGNHVVLGIGEQSVSNRYIAECVAALTGASVSNEGEDSTPSFVFDNGDAYENLGFRLRYSIEDTVKYMVV